MYHNHQLHRPCLYCHPQCYIRMVQHLIERCLLLHMSLDQCIRALAVHASIRPLVTLTGESCKRRISTSSTLTSMLHLLDQPLMRRCSQEYGDLQEENSSGSDR